MLPFMKDSENNPATDVGGMSPPAGTTHENSYLTVSGRGQHVRHTTVFVVAMFILGLLSLGLMVKKSRPQLTLAATDVATEEAKIEAAISRLTGVRSEMMSRMDNIIDKFYEFSDVHQIDVGELAKNPFQMEMFMRDDEALDAGQQLTTDANVFLKQRMLKEAGQLELLSIMLDEQGGRCMINDTILVVGDRLDSFIVHTVGERQVELHWRPLGEALSKEQADELKTALKLTE